MESEYKHYTTQAKTGIKGEAFFESLIADYALPHRIVGSKDIGIDYICEWSFGDRPTGILFAVQVKTFSERTAKPQFIDIHKTHNGLARYQIRNDKLKINDSTLSYWKGVGIPVFLFVMIVNSTSRSIDCYYRRYAPLLTTKSADPCGKFFEGFYLANSGSEFHAFKDKEKLGFARDLFIDHVRCCYAKGLLTYLNPRSMGLNQFTENAGFSDLFQEYEKEIRSVYEQTGKYLTALENTSSAEQIAIPSSAPPEEDDD